VRESFGFLGDLNPVRVRTVPFGGQAQTPTFEISRAVARDDKEANCMADMNRITNRRAADRDILAERRARNRRIAEQHHLRVMVESMLRRGCSETEITTAVERARAS
jgi:hypothetical protein